MMLIMVTSPIESFFMRSLDLLAASKSGLAANWLPDCIHNGKLTCQRTIQPGSRLKLVLGVLLSGHRIDPRRFEQACGIQLLERLHEFGQRHLGAEGALLGGEASAVVSVHIVSASIDAFQAQPAPLR